MSKMVYKCYIEEYRNDVGRLCARLRDKDTDKKVSLVSDNPFLKQQFLAFLSQAKIHQDIMPTVYDKNGTDIVQVCGTVIRESNDEIEVNPYGCVGGGFLLGIVKKSGPTLVKTHILWGTHFTGPIFRSYLCL